MERDALQRDKYLSINPQLEKNIPLDDAASALRTLIPLAESTFQQYSHDLVEFLPVRNTNFDLTIPKLATYEMLAASGLRTFIPSRKDYSRFREGSGTIDSYIERAEHSLTFVSINLLTGTQLESIKRVIQTKLQSLPKFIATISLLDPKSDALMASVAPTLNTNGPKLATDILDTLETLKRWKGELGARARNRFHVRTHVVLPLGSAIIIDEDSPKGTIQIETKAYKAPLQESFAFEIGDGQNSNLFKSLLEGFRVLLREGTELT
jgi:hypothetical protein